MACVVAVIAIAAAAVAAGGTAYSASANSSAAQAANAANQFDISNTNQLNYAEFLQSRGATGSAIYPVYGANAEQQLYQNTLGTYDATGSLQPTAAQLTSMVAQAYPAASEATTAAGDIFNGQTVNRELQQNAPVAAANLALAQTQKQGTLEALQQTLNNIKSIQAGKGYAGDSFQNSLLNFQARQQANTAGAQAIAGANLTNAKSVQGIQENAINRELQNLNAPSNALSQQVGIAQAPANALEQQQVARQNLFSNFKIGTQAFQYQAPPLVTPTATPGAIAGQGIGSLASALGSAYANKNTANSLNDLATLYSGFSTGTSTGGALPESVPTGETISALNSSGTIM